MKKLILTIISIILLTGCTSKTTQKEVTFWTLQMGDFAPYINEVIYKYESEHPQVNIKWVYYCHLKWINKYLKFFLSFYNMKLINGKC